MRIQTRQKTNRKLRTDSRPKDREVAERVPAIIDQLAIARRFTRDRRRCTGDGTTEGDKREVEQDVMIHSPSVGRH
jgi:hypothetical protein